MAHYEALEPFPTSNSPRLSLEQYTGDQQTPSPCLSQRGSVQEAKHVAPALTESQSFFTTYKDPSDPHLTAEPHAPYRLPLNKFRKRRWWHRVGLFGLFTLAGGTVIILASCAMLLLLWKGAQTAQEGGQPLEFWQTLVFENMTTRVITICSAAIRVSIGLHLGVVAAAIAALILETTGLQFRDIAAVSIQRASGSSPYTILPAALRTAKRHSRGVLHSSVILIGILIFIVSTFTSTLLLTDLKNVGIAGRMEKRQLRVGLAGNTDLPPNGVLHYRSSPSANWRFAEKKYDINPVPGIADTGDTYRASLPFQKETSRTTLEYYSGPGLVNNFRTVCLGPSLEDIEYQITESNGSLAITVDMMFKNHAPGYLEGWGLNVSCNSILLTRWNKSDPHTMPLSLGNNCQVRSRNGYLPVDPLSGQNYSIIPLALFQSKPYLRHAFGHLALSDDLYRTEKFDRLLELKKIRSKKNGVWTEAALTNGTQVFSTTLCLLNGNEPELYNITMRGDSVPIEPTVEIRRHAGSTNSSLLQKQLGIGVPYSNNDERGIMRLDIGPRNKSYSDSGAYSVRPWSTALYNALLGFSPRGGWGMADYKDAYEEDWLGWFAAHTVHVSLMQDILRRTGNPALAIQALAFRFYQMNYYDSLEDLDLSREVEVIHSTDKSIPVQWTGLVIVLVMVIIHIFLLCSTMVLFLLQTQASELGNAWQTIAQVVSPPTEMILREASEMTDKDIQSWARRSGIDSGLYHLSTSTVKHRREVQRRD